MSELLVPLSQTEANTILATLYELPFKYAVGTIYPIQKLLISKFELSETKKTICQTCGVSGKELVIPFGASNTWVCVDCMQCIQLRIEQTNQFVETKELL